MKRRRKSRDFTLVELMVVLAILVLLVAMVGPRLLGTQKKADVKATVQQIENLSNCLKLYAVDNRTYPATEDGLKALLDKPAETETSRVTSWDGPYLDAEELPVVSTERCTACGDCVEICPLDLFTLEPISKKLLVQCNSPLTGDLARSICRVACDGCARCALDAGPRVIEMQSGLPVVLHHNEANESCTHRCPTGAIQWVEGDQFESAPPGGDEERRSHG